MGQGRRTYQMVARAEGVADTRERILEAARSEFLGRRFEDVTLNDIADAAGVTRQTVLNHFESKDGTFLAAAETVIQQRHTAARGDAEDALDALVAEYEQYGDVLVRLIEVEDRFPAVHTQLEHGRKGHREWVEETFGGALPSSGSQRDRDVLALVSATDVLIWKLLRRDLRRSRATAREVIGALVAGVVAKPASDQEGP